MSARILVSHYVNFAMNFFTIIVICVLTLTLFSCATRVQNDEDVQRIKTAKINAQLGMAYLENKNVKLAKQKFLLAYDQAPEIPETLFSLGYFFESTGDLSKAQNYYLSSLKAAPSRGDVHNNYGTFLCRQGRYRESIAEFMIATTDTRYLNLADVYENAANCAYRMGDIQLAKQYFYQTVDHDPTRSNAMFALAQLNFKGGNKKLAAHYLQRFLLISPPTAASQRLMTALNITTQKAVQKPSSDTSHQPNLASVKHPSLTLHAPPLKL